MEKSVGQAATVKVQADACAKMKNAKMTLQKQYIA